MLLATLFMVACNNDENTSPIDPEVPGIADNVVGTYKGEAKMTVGDQEMPTKFDVIIAKKGPKTVAINLVGPADGGKMSIKNMIMEDIEVVKVEDKYTLSKEAFKCKDGEMEWNIERMHTTVADKALEMNAVAKPGGMPMPIIITFKGNK